MSLLDFPGSGEYTPIGFRYARFSFWGARTVHSRGRPALCYKSSDMRVKLTYALPLAQMVLASALIWWSELWERAANRICDMPGPAPAFDLLVSINAPAALVRASWRRLPYSVFHPMAAFLLDNGALVIAIGLLWYWVALNIYSWRLRRTVFIFRWMPLRLGGDALLIAVGVFWGISGIDDGRHSIVWAHARGMSCFGPYVWSRWLPSIAATGLDFTWCFALIYLFGRDFLHGVFRKTPVQARPAQN